MRVFFLKFKNQVNTMFYFSSSSWFLFFDLKDIKYKNVVKQNFTMYFGQNQRFQQSNQGYSQRKAPSNETLAFAKSMNMNIWVVGTSNQLFTTNFSKKKKKNSCWQNSIFCDRSILYSPFYCLSVFDHFMNLALKGLIFVSDSAVLYGNVSFSIFLYSTKKLYSSLLKKVLVFQKICFKVKVLKTF